MTLNPFRKHRDLLEAARQEVASSRTLLERQQELIDLKERMCQLQSTRIKQLEETNADLIAQVKRTITLLKSMQGR